MPVPRQFETRGPLEFLLSEAAGFRSRETVTIKEGETLKAGHVLGVDGDGKHREYNPANDDGTETAVAVLGYDTDAGDADVEAMVIQRDAEVHAALLVWFDAASDAEQATGHGELAAQSNIHARS